MRTATVKARRRLVDGRKLVQVACPHCQHRHWLPESPTGWCSRRAATFTIANPDRTQPA